MYQEPRCKTLSVEELCMEWNLPYLNEAEENELAVTSSVGYGRTRKQVMEIVESTAQEKKIKN